MFNIDNPHQFFDIYDNNDVLVCHWTMDKIKHKDTTIWVMNHFFFNPTNDSQKSIPLLLDEEMETAKSISKESGCPIWPLDPKIIDYFKNHPDFYDIWYQKPFTVE